MPEYPSTVSQLEVGAAPGVASLDVTGNVPLAQLGNAPGGAATGLFSTYLMYYTGTSYVIKNWYTGTVYASNSSAATIASNLGTLLNTSSENSPIAVIIDVSVNLSGQTWQTYGSGFKILGLGGGLQNASSGDSPNLGSFTLGVSGHASNIGGVGIEGVNFETETITDVSAFISDVTHHNVGYRGVNTHAIVINTSGGNGIQYLRWTGSTCFAVQNNGPNADFFFVQGNTSSVGHSFFEYIQQVGGTGLSVWSMFHFANGAKWHRLEVVAIDLNTNATVGQAYEPTLVQFDGGSSAATTQCPAIWFGAVHWEQHLSTGNPSLVQAGTFTAGNLNASIVVSSLWVNSGVIALFTNNGNGNAIFTGNGFFLDVRSIVADTPVIAGSWSEGTNFPIRVGPCVSQHTPLNSGDYLSTPVSSGVLSLAGTGAFATGTTYTVGGTQLGALLNGTVTLTSADGTVILNAVALTQEIVTLACGMQLLVAGGGTAKFWKAE